MKIDRYRITFALLRAHVALECYQAIGAQGFESIECFAKQSGITESDLMDFFLMKPTGKELVMVVKISAALHLDARLRLLHSDQTLEVKTL